jgi:cell fate regulator YaaT (PSP1 superfamily)
MRLIGVFEAYPPIARLGRSQPVILRTDRGQESGEILCAATPEAIAAIPEPTHGQILRTVTADDRQRIAEIEALESQHFAIAEALIQQHHLPMQLVHVEHLFGGERIIFYFLAENRVDFRELVKSMARQFQTRIELRQIGVRDEAKLKADYGDCGKPVCCNSHMVVMPPVSMRMAKLQKSTLDPTKISGRCGRLKCCLRFENDVYEEFQAELPAVGDRVVTTKGQGTVLAQEILSRRLLIEFEDGRRLPVAAAEVLTRL